jgi:hypothetical protein
MSESLLKKEFKQSDVQRVRNLVNKDFTSSTKQQAGYQKTIEHHEEGEIWEAEGKSWTIKNGLKQNITKLDKFKKLGKMPLFCPECNTLMKKRLDKKVFPAYQKCFTCIVDYEAELTKQGKSEDYFNSLRNQHIQKSIDGYKSFMQSKMKETNANFVTEAGDVENWKGGMSKEQIEHDLQEGIEFLEGLMIK